MKKVILFFISIVSVHPSFFYGMHRRPTFIPRLLKQNVYARNYSWWNEVSFSGTPAIEPEPSKPEDVSDISIPDNNEKIEPSYIHLPKELSSSGIARVQGEFPSEVTNIIKFIKNRERYDRMGAKFPTGLLLVGKPGTGKTLVGKAISQEVGFPFVYASVSDFEGKWYGDAEKAIRNFFKNAREKAKLHSKKSVIAFLDEMDAIGSRTMPTTNEEHIRRRVTTLLTQMDGADKDPDDDGQVYIFGASNDTKTIDPALLRPGRFDRIVEVPLPNKKSRKAILSYYAQAIRYHKEEVDFDELTSLTDGYTPAELKHLINEAALFAVRCEADHVTKEHFEYALLAHQQREELRRFDGLQTALSQLGIH